MGTEMSDFYVVVLGIIQGIGEFFPISSSTHLILASHWFEITNGGMMLDVALHTGTLGALVVYFARDVGRLIKGFYDCLRRHPSPDGNFFLSLCLATIPLVCVGLALDLWGGGSLRSLTLLGVSSIVFGLVMYGVDRACPANRPLNIPPLQEAFWGWGWAQVLAFIHGASRSGVCMTYGRLQGYRREDCARFAFLMAIPALGAASCLKITQFILQGDWSLLRPGLLGMGVSFLTGLVSLVLFMAWLRHFNLKPFALYRIMLGIFILVTIYFL